MWREGGDNFYITEQYGHETGKLNFFPNIRNWILVLIGFPSTYQIDLLEKLFICLFGFMAYQPL